MANCAIFAHLSHASFGNQEHPEWLLHTRSICGCVNMSDKESWADVIFLALCLDILRVEIGAKKQLHGGPAVAEK